MLTLNGGEKKKIQEERKEMKNVIS